MVVRVDQSGDDQVPLAGDHLVELARRDAWLKVRCRSELDHPAVVEHEAVIMQRAERVAARRDDGRLMYDLHAGILGQKRPRTRACGTGVERIEGDSRRVAPSGA